MPRYLVENSRPRQIVTLFGKVLASSVSSRRNRPGQVWLSEAQYTSDQVKRLIEMKRLRLVEVVDEGTREPVDRVASVADVDRILDARADDFDGLVPPGAPLEIPPVSTSDGVDPADPVDDAPAGDDPPPSIVPPADVVKYTREELDSLGFQELRALAKSLDVSSSGKAAEIIERVLSAQEQP